MAKTKVSIPEGFEKKEISQPFWNWEKDGEALWATFLGTKEAVSTKYNTKQVVWVVRQIGTDAVYQVAEKAVMEKYRLELREGDRFGLVYTGEQESNVKGRKPFKTFEFYLEKDRTPF